MNAGGGRRHVGLGTAPCVSTATFSAVACQCQPICWRPQKRIRRRGRTTTVTPKDTRHRDRDTSDTERLRDHDGNGTGEHAGDRSRTDDPQSSGVLPRPFRGRAATAARIPAHRTSLQWPPAAGERAGTGEDHGGRGSGQCRGREVLRIQCTPDLLPADIIGSQIYNAHEGSFSTVLGPVHANIVLLDEINRSSAKTQSAMLEAMQEKQTTIGGKRFDLPAPSSSWPRRTLSSRRARISCPKLSSTDS